MIDEKHPLASFMLEYAVNMMIDIAKESDNYFTLTRTTPSTGEKWKITVENITEGEIEHEN